MDAERSFSSGVAQRDIHEKEKQEKEEEEKQVTLRVRVDKSAAQALEAMTAALIVQS